MTIRHIKNISLSTTTRIKKEIEEGDFILVSGPVGCGKSTLLKSFLIENALSIDNNNSYSNGNNNKK